MGSKNLRFSKSLLLAILLCCSLAGYSQQVTLTASSGTASGTFTTLKDAFDAINAGTHQGAIVISINSSTYETASAVLNASGSGSASYTGINIYPTTTGLSIASINTSLEAPLIDLNGADNVTIDGRVNATGSTKSLTISNTSALSTAGTSTIRFIADASSNTVRYCTLKGSSTDAAASVVFFSTGTSTGNDNNTIDNNDITNAADGSRPINAVYALGATAVNNTNTISNNNIYDFLSRGAASNGINIGSNNSAFTISDNSFYETASFTASAGVAYNVILISAATGSGNGFTISGNYIGGRLAQCGGSAWTKATGQNNAFTAISVTTATGTANSIQGNTIQNISWTNTGVAAFTGISLSGATVANIGTTAGNLIGAATGTGSIIFTSTITNTDFFGINIASTDVVDCQNNTIGAITAANAEANATNFRGIYKLNTTGTTTIISNTIGSTTTAGSINASSGSTSYAQTVFGINSLGSGTVTISGNMVANMVNATSNTTTSTAGRIAGIYVQDGTNTISGNTVRNLSIANANAFAFTTSSVIGIGIYTPTSVAATVTQTVSGNTVYNLSNSYSSFTGHVVGIYYNARNASTVSSNFIHSLSVTGTSSTTARLYGIKINSGATTYSNNIISLGGNTKSDIYGIYETGALNQNNSLYFNTVYISGSLASDATNKSYALYSAVNTNTRNFRNNVLVNARSTASGASKHYALFAVSGGTTLTCDYNQYYVSGTGGVLGFFGSDIASLPIVTGQDAASIATNPAFISTGTEASEYAPTVPGTGVTGTGITTDYLGNTRGAAVSMGAIDGSSWTGATSTDWATTSNWTSGAAPVAGSIVNIPSGRTNYPSLSDDRTLSSLALASGASLNLNNNTLTLTSGLSNAGSITGAGKLTMGGSSAQSISGTGTVSNLEVNNSTGVTITSGAGNMTLSSLALASGSSLNLNSNTLTLTSGLSNAGSISGDGKLTMGGSSAQSISGTGTVSNLEVNNSTGVTITSGAGNMQSITGVLTPTAGTLTTNGNLTLKSSASGTARVAAVPASGAAITGNVTVERYLPLGRKWRMLTAPLTGSSNNSIFYNWQNNDVPNGNTGVEIWGPSGVADPSSSNDGLANGLSASMRSYGVGGWANVTSTTLTPLFDNTTNYGYALFATGPYNNGSTTYIGGPGSLPAAAATTLSATGSLITGDHTKNLSATAANQFFLVGNPYASPVNPRSFTETPTVNRTNLNGKLWMWDAKPGTGSGLGRYVSFDLSSNAYSVPGNGYADDNVMIQSGQAFFVQSTASGAATLVFHETSKNANGSHAMMGDEIRTPKALLRLTLQQPVTADSADNLDGVVAVFHAEGKAGLDPLDGSKLMNSSENIFFRREARSLTFEHRPNVTAKDTLYLRMSNLQNRTYRLQVRATDFPDADVVTAELTDRFTGKSIPISLKGDTDHAFAVTADSMSTGDRFMVVFSKAAAPVTVLPDTDGGDVLKLYPNPVREKLKVAVNTSALGFMMIQVFDASGSEVWRRTGIASGTKTVEVNTAGLRNGVYMLRLTDAKGETRVEKFVRE